MLARVRANPSAFVLKRPLDTRSHGVVLGIESPTPLQWESALERAVAQGWLIQAYYPSTEFSAYFRGTTNHHHDLCIAAVNGRMVGTTMRSNASPRLNVARNGRLHQVFVESS